jgi:hypothetical protein
MDYDRVFLNRKVLFLLQLKKRLFSHRRTRSESNDEELVCPFDGEENGKVTTNGSHNSSPVWSRGRVITRDNKEVIRCQM